MAEFNIRKLETDQYEQWDQLVDRSPQGCIFCKAFWLKAIGNEFYILGCFDKSERLIGGIPIVFIKKGHIGMPKITQTLGIVYDDFSGMKYVKKITKEKDITQALVENMPNFTTFNYGFHYNFTNWMPFMWKGYNQYSRYTYVIEDISSIDKVRGDFLDTTRSIINKAVKSNLRIVNDYTVKEMYSMLEKTFSRQNKKVPFEYDWFVQFDKVLSSNNAREMFFCIDEENNLHAALYLVLDKNSAYYLLGGGDPKFRNSGAMYLNVFEAIKYSSQFTNKFDFEGSIVPQIEHMFRSFGATQKQFFHISKNKSILLNLKTDIRKYGKLVLKR